MAERSVAKLIRGTRTMDGAGVSLTRIFGFGKTELFDPFLLLDSFGSKEPGEYLAGFPWHPHRGIETVTYMLAGRVDHRDSLGNAGTIGAGDVQWMTAGGGILHEEMPKPVEGRMAGFQLWVNLPARLKMTAPRYQEVPAASLPVIREGGAEIRVLAGQVGGIRGPMTDIAADPIYLDVDLASGANWEHPVHPEHTVCAYIFEGDGTLGEPSQTEGGSLSAPSFVVLGGGDTVAARAGEAGLRFLLIAGQPLREPIARYGPFVMNTQEEIRQALADLRNGTFVRSGTGTGTVSTRKSS